MSELRRRFIRELELRNRSPQTVQNYLRILHDLTRYAQKSPLKLTQEELADYLHHNFIVKKLAPATINQQIGCLRFFYKTMCPDSEIMQHIGPMRVPKKIPTVLSVQEVRAMLNATPNLKHRAILQIFYSAGLRLQELLDLTPPDIDSQQMLIRVRAGKGGKERYTLLSNQTLLTLREYYRYTRPRHFLFEGRNFKQYSKRSVEKIVESAAKKAGIHKRVSPHVLRHTFATHLLDQGVSLRIIQKLMGHGHINTTTIYTHVSTQNIQRVRNPLDILLQEHPSGGKEQAGGVQ